MQIFKNRPLAFAICIFAILSIISYQLPASLKLLCFFILLLMTAVYVLIALLRKNCGKNLTVLILCSSLAAVAVFQSWFHFYFLTKPFHDKEGQTVTVEGYVVDVLNTGNVRSRYEVHLLETDGERSDAKVLLECTYYASLQRGDTFRLTGVVRVPRNSREYAEETVLLSDGYVGIITCEDYQSCTVYDVKSSTLRIKMYQLRSVLSTRLDMALDRDAGALASALLLGDRGGLSGDTILDFNRCGISHLLALSGIHISVIILLWEIVLRRLKIPKQCRAILVPALAFFYLFLTGCAPSTFRAVLMLCMTYLSYLFSSDYDSFTSLCVSLLLILTVSPYAVSDISMWMSFVATAGIVIFVPAVAGRMERMSLSLYLPKWLFKLLQALVTAVAVGLFANAAILPLLVYFFGEASWYSIGATLLLSPVLGVALPLSALTLLLPWCRPLVLCTQAVLRIFPAVAGYIGNTSNAIVLTNGKLTLALTAVLAILLGFFALVYLKKKRWLLLPVTLSFVILGVAAADTMPKSAGVSVTYICNNYEEALVLSEGKAAVAFDMSSGSETIGRRICEVVQQSKCTELQELVLTHYHPQATGLISSLSSDIKVRSLRMPIPNCEKEQSIAKRLEQEAALHGIAVCYGNDDFSLNGVQIRLQERLPKDTAIEVPILLSMCIGEKNLVYLGGEIWNGDLRSFAENNAISADYLIFGVHGMSSAPTESFFARLGTDKSVIFGHENAFYSCPIQLLPAEYTVAVLEKRFFVK